ncbi:MAG TPA: hypothetical protein ENK43_16525 [Planctomycetes bacterium]|nr:hypothetical protein [Planctomycetota bacterium]
MSLEIRDPEEARALADILDVLAGLFAKEIHAEDLEALTSEAMVAMFKELGSTAPADLRERRVRIGDDALLEELAVDFADTFLGPGPHVGPHESIHRADAAERSHWGPSTAEVSRFLREHGIEIDDGFSGFPDHLSIELGVVAQLLRLFAESDDPRESNEAMSLARGFIDEHLSQWLPAFLEELKGHTNEGFYRDLGQVTGVVAAEFLGVA